MDIEIANNVALQKLALVLESSGNMGDLIFEHLPDIFVILDHSHRIIRANRSACVFLKVEEYDLLGKLFLSFIRGEGQSLFSNFFTEPQGDIEKNCKFEAKTSDDKDEFVFWQINAFRTESNDEMFIVVGTDTSELKKAHEKVLKHEQILEVAKSVQTHLMPRGDYSLSEYFEVIGCCEPAEKVGGDWWWYSIRNTDDLVVFTGDISGHGVDAGLGTATAVSFNHAVNNIEQTYGLNLNISDILIKLNEFFIDLNKKLHSMSVCGVEIQAETNEAIVYFCGCPPVIVLRKDSFQLINLGSDLLGIDLENFSVKHKKIPFQKGERIIIVTDGCYEYKNRTNGRRYTLKKLATFAHSIRHLPIKDSRNMLFQHINQTRDGPQKDDVTFVMIERK